MTRLSRIDRDALERAVRWIERWQRGMSPKILPSPMPKPGTAEWVEEAQRAASIAQSRTLGLPPWRLPPCRSYAYGESAEEVGLRQRIRRAGISLWEPDPVAALERAGREAGRASRK